MPNRFKAALQSGECQIGLWAALTSPYTTEICAGAGFDWVLIDGEHAPNDLPLLLAQLQAAAAYPVSVLLRPPVGDVALIKQYLDIGCTTLLIPMVDTAEQAAAMVRAVRYPPEGIRGVGAALARAARWGRTPDYLAQANDGICLLVQIESAEAIGNLDAIAAVPGIDGLFIGPSDLAASMGYLGQPGHPAVWRAIEDTIGRIQAVGKAAGLLVTDEALIRRSIELGCRFVAVGTDVSVLARGTEVLARKYRALAPAAPNQGY